MRPPPPQPALALVVPPPLAVTEPLPAHVSVVMFTEPPAPPPLSLQFLTGQPGEIGNDAVVGERS